MSARVTTRIGMTFMISANSPFGLTCHKMRALNFITISLAIVVTACGQRIKQPDSEVLARQMLASFSKSIDSENLRSFGLETRSQAESLQLGDSVNLFFIRLDELRNFKMGDKIDELVRPTKEIIYEINQADKQPYGAVELELVDNNWNILSIGQSEIVKRFEILNKDRPKRVYSLIKIPALDHAFSAYRKGKEWIVIKLDGESTLAQIPRREIPILEVIPILQDEAKRYNGLPR